MRAIANVLMLIVSLATIDRGLACPMPSGAPWLAMHKPVLSDVAKLTSTYGMLVHPLLQKTRMHTGIDWAADLGTPIVAAGQGVVLEAGRKGEKGNMIIIDHGGGRQTLYAHLSNFSASVADCVESGTVIGNVGATGLVSGPSLHFEVLENGQPVDPLSVPVVSAPK